MSDCQRPECNGVGEYIPGAKCAHVRQTRAESYWNQDPPEFEECDRDAIEGSAYCKRHQGCEKGNCDE